MSNHGVTILKPLMGTDKLLEKNLKSHFELDYPNLELIFCVKDPHDKEVIHLVQKLMFQFPKVDAKLMVGGTIGIINPLVNNIAKAYEISKYPILWISTSRIETRKSHLLDMLEAMNSSENVALVHQLPFYSPDDFSSHIVEKISFASSLARNYISLNTLGICCFTGMSYLLRKKHLDALGGIKAYGKYLAEDYFFSRDLFKRGHKVILSRYPVHQNISNTSVHDYRTRFVRWLRLRINMIPFVALVLEPLQETITIGILLLISLYHYQYLVSKFAVISFLWFYLITIMVLDYVTFNLLQENSCRNSISLVKYSVYWLRKEIATYQIFLEALMNPQTVNWGGVKFKLKIGGIVSESK